MNKINPDIMNEITDVLTLALRHAYPEGINVSATSAVFVALAVKYLAVYGNLGEVEAKRRLIGLIKNIPMSDMTSIDIKDVLQ